MNFQWLLIFSLKIFPIISFKFKEYPYADMNIEEKVAYDGYPLKIYKLRTEDNYFLTTYRIPYGRKYVNTTKRSPVLLVHGLGASPEMYILQGPNKSLAYNLADGGFDVWLLNARGVRKSQRHKYYNLNTDSRYWNFGFHEVSVYDIPANIDLIVNKTSQKVFVIGHSQGNTCYFVMLTNKPEYNEKIKIGVAYAPSIKLYVDNPIITLFLYITDIIKTIYDLLGFHELVPFSNMLPIAIYLCKEQTYFLELCYHIMSVVGSHTSKIIDKDLVPVIVGALHARVSAIQLFHYMQIIRTGQFGQYDYGHKKNMQIYGSTKPPEYDLNKITSPVAVFYGPKDDLATIQGAEDTIKILPNVIYHEKVSYEYFNHIDFLFGKNASELVYQKTIKIFQEFDNSFEREVKTKINQN